MPLTIEYLGGNCPVQSEGMFDDYQYYFRARGQHWSIELTDPTNLIPILMIKVQYGDSDFAAGWMPRDDAFKIIVSTYFKWKAGLLK